MAQIPNDPRPLEPPGAPEPQPPLVLTEYEIARHTIQEAGRRERAELQRRHLAARLGIVLPKAERGANATF